jgi:RNA polymerase sigma-70 factor (ECF subfamily)
LYDDQDEKFGTGTDQRGGYYLNAASGNGVPNTTSSLIAYWSTQKPDTAEKWENVLRLGIKLVQLENSPIAASTAHMRFQVKGKQAAIEEAEKLQLVDNQFYYTLLGELYTGIDTEKARQHFTGALSLAKTETAKKSIQRKMAEL